MKKLLLSSSPFYQQEVLAIIRMIVGGLMIYHGQEVFQPNLMREYMTWEVFQDTNARLLVYAGKSSELIAGVSLFLGLFTRIGSLLLLGAMSYVTFVMGNGEFWYGDQHPFMFVLFGLLFFFFGAGMWSVDQRIFGERR
jgi:putative oxidoreductase